MSTMTDGPPLLTIREVARRLEKDRSTIRRWVNRGYLHGKRLGGRTYITADELDRFLRNGGGQR